MKIAIGCDHGGFKLKDAIVRHIQEKGHEVVDFGTFTTDSCDYPVYAREAALSVSHGECDRGIVMCVSGIGVSIVSNKVKGIRCALCTCPRMAMMTRLHNNANMLALGADYIDRETALEIVDMFLDTEFSNEERHIRRISMIEG